VSIAQTAAPDDAAEVYEWKVEGDRYLSYALEQLIVLARIPEDREYDFLEEFSLCVVYDLLGYRFWTNPEIADGAFLEAEEAMHQALATLARLTPRQKVQLSLRLTGLPQRGPRAYRDVLDEFAVAFARVTGNPPVRLYLREKKRGRPQGRFGNWQFSHLVGALFQFPWKYGGALTFHGKDPDKGTLVKAVRLLEPLFPAIVPRHLPLDTIADIRDECRKCRAEFDAFPSRC
jgi:hypothetical protein